MTDESQPVRNVGDGSFGDDALREALRAEVPQPGPGYWDTIDAALAHPSGVPLTHAARARRSWARPLAAAAILLFAAGGVAWGTGLLGGEDTQFTMVATSSPPTALTTTALSAESALLPLGVEFRLVRIGSDERGGAAMAFEQDDEALVVRGSLDGCNQGSGELVRLTDGRYEIVSFFQYGMMCGKVEEVFGSASSFGAPFSLQYETQFETLTLVGESGAPWVFAASLRFDLETVEGVETERARLYRSVGEAGQVVLTVSAYCDTFRGVVTENDVVLSPLRSWRQCPAPAWPADHASPFGRQSAVEQGLERGRITLTVDEDGSQWVFMAHVDDDDSAALPLGLRFGLIRVGPDGQTGASMEFEQDGAVTVVRGSLDGCNRGSGELVRHPDGRYEIPAFMQTLVKCGEPEDVFGSPSPFGGHFPWRSTQSSKH